jgi:hypothetical protein
MCTMAVRESWPAVRSTCRVRMCALQSEGKIILIYSYFEIRVHPYYDMTLRYKSLGLVVALF